MYSIVKRKKKLQMTLLLPFLMVAMSCSQTSPLPTWPTKLEVVELSDGGVCFSKESAKRLSEFKADLEAL